MNSQDLRRLLGDTAFLDGADQETCGLLADLARVDDIAPDTVLFREGQEANAVFIVVTGQVALEIACPQRGRLRFQTVGPGELLGWSPLLGQPRMTATGRTLTAAQVIRLEAAPLLALCQQQPRFGMEIMRRTAIALARRLAATRLQLLDVFRHELPAGGAEAQA